jgi:D-glycero-alpha-D-manno-heptose 1-phosphate guanylyltransferase
VTEVVVLAGGEGKRLRPVVRDLPKPMADVAGRPFLWWLLTRLKRQGVPRVILSVGYKAEVIQAYFGTAFDGMKIAYSIETEPLGTGGAMRLALEHATGSRVIVLNGDTFTDINLPDFSDLSENSEATLAIGVTFLNDVARYGAVVIDDKQETVIGFEEKQGAAAGYINAGVYCLHRDIFVKYPVPGKFSFERDFLPARLAALKPVAFKGVRGFIDIGVPEDYERAQTLIPELAAAVARTDQ